MSGKIGKYQDPSIYLQNMGVLEPSKKRTTEVSQLHGNTNFKVQEKAQNIFGDYTAQLEEAKTMEGFSTHVKPANQLPGKPARSLGKANEFFLTVIAKFSKGAETHLDARKAEHEEYIKLQEALIKDSLTEQVTLSKNLDEAHRSHKSENNDPTKPIDVAAHLILDQGQTNVKLKSNQKTAELAQEYMMHKSIDNGGLVAEVEVKGLGTLVSYSFPGGELVKGEGVNPTSAVLADPTNADHLMNTYVLMIGDKQAVIRTGRIDTEQRANEFEALIRDIYEQCAQENPGVKLRIVSQQLNSFETESKIIDGQHRWIAHVNKKLGKDDLLKGKVELIHINVPSNRFYHMTRLVKSFGAIGNFIESKFLKGEQLSKEQNLDSLGTYSKWVNEDLLHSLRYVRLRSPALDNMLQLLTTGNDKIYNTNKEAIDVILTNLETKKEALREIEQKFSEGKGEFEKETIAAGKAAIKAYNVDLKAHRAALKELLIADKQDYELLEKVLKDIPEPAAQKAFQTVSLMRQMLGSQLGIEKMSRGKEGMVFQLLNDNLGVSAAMNCKSGLDRTGFWHAVKLSTLSLEKQFIKEIQDNGDYSDEGVAAASARAYALVNEWDETTEFMNRVSARLGEKEYIGDFLNKSRNEWVDKFGPTIMSEDQLKVMQQKMKDVNLLRNEVANNMIKIGVPITTASTGMSGLKWNSGMQENLIPLNFLPSHVNKTNEGPPPTTELVSLVKYSKSGEISGISKMGRALLTKFQKLRGS